MKQEIMDLISKMFDSNKDIDNMNTNEIIKAFGNCDLKQFSQYSNDRLQRFKEIDENLNLEQQKNYAELQIATISEYGSDYEQTIKDVKNFNKTVRNMKKQYFEHSNED